jgi:hypothetical protein
LSTRPAIQFGVSSPHDQSSEAPFGRATVRRWESEYPAASSQMVHAEGEVRLGFHGQVRPRLVRARRYLYAMLLRRVAFPDFCEPCLPSPAAKPPAGDGWVHEIKLNGFRLARRDAAGVRLLTRRGIDWTTSYPSIAAAGAVERVNCFTLKKSRAVVYFGGKNRRGCQACPVRPLLSLLCTRSC